MIVHYKNLLWGIIICFRFTLTLGQTKGMKNLLSDKLVTQNITKNDDNYGYIHETRNFLFYKSNIIYERSCTCEMDISCSCCESVVLLFTKSLGKLCGNLMYRPEGLNVNITLDGNTIRSMTVTNYRPFKICALIPKSLFSIICLNILELNLFPRSITACPRLEIATKNQNWKINYTCVSISTPMGSEVDSLNMNNPNRLTNSGTTRPSTTLRNQTTSMRSVSPPKQTQSQLSAMTPSVINLLNSNRSITGMTSETPRISPTSSMITFMQSSRLPIPLSMSSSTLKIPITIPSSTSSTSRVILSSRNLPFTATTKLTCKKTSEITDIKTNFRNHPSTATTSSTLSTKKSTPHFENTPSMSSHNLPNISTIMLATTKQSSISFSTPAPVNYSSLITESNQDTSETNSVITDSTLISSTNISTISTTSMDNQEILETLNMTLNPIISVIPIIFPDNYSNVLFDEFNFNDTNNLPTTSESSFSSTNMMEDETSETVMEIMLTTQIIPINDTQNSDDQEIETTIESLENTTTLQTFDSEI